MLEYLVLAAGLAADEPFVDDLAVRSILELESAVGPTRIRAVVRHCYESGQRFTAGVSYLLQHPAEYTSTNIAGVGAAVDEILGRTRAMQPLDDIGVRDWFEAVRSALCFEFDDRSTLHAILNDLLEELEADQNDGNRVAIIERLTAGLMNPQEAAPTTVEGQVTITTMHAAAVDPGCLTATTGRPPGSHDKPRSESPPRQSARGRWRQRPRADRVGSLRGAPGLEVRPRQPAPPTRPSCTCVPAPATNLNRSDRNRPLTEGLMRPMHLSNPTPR